MTSRRAAFRVAAIALALCWFSSARAFDTTGSRIKLLDNVPEFKVGDNSACMPAGTVLRVVNAKSADSVTVKIDSFTRPGATLPAGCLLPTSLPITTEVVQAAAKAAGLSIDPKAPQADVDVAARAAATAAIPERDRGFDKAEASAIVAAKKVAPMLADNVINAIARRAASMAMQVTTYQEYKITTADLAKHDYIRQGLSYGTLVVPFKYQTHDHSLQQGVTLGGYVGYQTPFLGMESDYDFTLTPLIFAGGSWATLSQTQTTASAQTTTTTNQLGISYGVGTLFTINNSYQLGLIVGWDRLGSNASPPSPYEGKAWVSFAIGWNFAQ